jgi:hypothetical protein
VSVTDPIYFEDLDVLRGRCDRLSDFNESTVFVKSYNQGYCELWERYADGSCSMHLSSRKIGYVRAHVECLISQEADKVRSELDVEHEEAQKFLTEEYA